MPALSRLVAVLVGAAAATSCQLDARDLGTEHAGTTNATCVEGESRPSEDGCNSCVCEQGEWLCTALGCPSTDSSGDDPPTQLAFDCPPDARFDPVFINDATLEANDLVLDVGYGGGCAPHVFELCWDGEFLESDPVQVQLRLSHDANGDPCEAALTEILRIPLGDLAEAYMSSYQTDTGAIDLGLEGWTGPLRYTF